MLTMRRTGAVAMLVMLAGCSAGPAAPEQPAQPAAAVTSSKVTGVAPPNAVVTLLPAAGDPPMPAEPALMDQISKQFLPNVLIVRVGQPVQFHNGEDLPHNVTVTRRGSGAEVFNVSTERAQTYTHTFDRVGQLDVKCDIHEGMEATVIVSNGPLTTVTDGSGQFTFDNVPLGSYRVSLTFAGQTVEEKLDVTGAQTSFKFSR